MPNMPFAALLIFYAIMMVSFTFMGKGPHIPGPWEIAFCIGGGVLGAAIYPPTERLIRAILGKPRPKSIQIRTRFSAQPNDHRR